VAPGPVKPPAPRTASQRRALAITGEKKKKSVTTGGGGGAATTTTTLAATDPEAADHDDADGTKHGDSSDRPPTAMTTTTDRADAKATEQALTAPTARLAPKSILKAKRVLQAPAHSMVATERDADKGRKQSPRPETGSTAGSKKKGGATAPPVIKSLATKKPLILQQTKPIATAAEPIQVSAASDRDDDDDDDEKRPAAQTASTLNQATREAEKAPTETPKKNVNPPAAIDHAPASPGAESSINPSSAGPSSVHQMPDSHSVDRTAAPAVDTAVARAGSSSTNSNNIGGGGGDADPQTRVQIVAVADASASAEVKKKVAVLKPLVDGLPRAQFPRFMRYVRMHAPVAYQFKEWPPSPTHPTGRKLASVQLELLPTAVLDGAAAFVGKLATLACPCSDPKRSWEWIVAPEPLPNGRERRTGAAATARTKFGPALLKSRNEANAQRQLIHSVGVPAPPHFVGLCQRVCPGACDSKDGSVHTVHVDLLPMHAVGELQRFLDDATDETMMAGPSTWAAGGPELLLVLGTEVSIKTSHPVPRKRKQDETTRANSIGAKKRRSATPGGGGGGGANSSRTVHDDDDGEGDTQPVRKARRETKADQDDGDEGDVEEGEEGEEKGIIAEEEGDGGDENEGDEGDEEGDGAGDEDKIRHEQGTKIPVPDCPCNRCERVRANASARTQRHREKKRREKREREAKQQSKRKLKMPTTAAKQKKK
jgi:hypothetical protein